jgi:hypothetical protein
MSGHSADFRLTLGGVLLKATFPGRPTVTHACRKRRLKWVATMPLGDINNTEAWPFGMGVGRGANNPTL